ncbi:hypothetical protein AQUCO_00200574v1 [Aquilegia coerulea]|uniref:Uncharacterized protein n=1 Tax=Aquilegia coerulea TaxID=218851 RepID=A0A2G5F3V2_AQUCA|nr:hypothetical protein AQUCO_00200574v1 [Aquilegia coerulea]
MTCQHAAKKRPNLDSKSNISMLQSHKKGRCMHQLIIILYVSSASSVHDSFVHSFCASSFASLSKMHSSLMHKMIKITIDRISILLQQ